MKFLKVLPKECMSNKVLTVHVKGKSCNSPKSLQISTRLFSSQYFKNVLGTIFYIEELR